MLSPEKTVLLVVDVQGKLAHAMHDKDALFSNLQKIIRGAQVLAVPIIVTEQNPEGLGPTITEIAPLLGTIRPISKLNFSCCANEQFMRELESLGRSQILLTGIETHICVYQTAVGLLDRGYEVQVVADAVTSRTPENKAIGLERVKDAGAKLTSTEMALYELLQIAEGPKFKEILKLVK